MERWHNTGRSSLLLLTLVAAVALYFIWLPFANNHHPPPIKIGVLHSLSGTMSTSEAPLVDAVRLAVEETNQSGGINGAPLEMVVEDCRSDASYCAKQADKLIVRDKVQALFGCWTSSCRKAVRPVVEQHRRLLFYPVQYEGLEQSPNIIYTGAAPNQQLIPMVDWALRHVGTNVYLLGSDYVFPRTANQIVRKLLQAQGGKVVAERYVPLGSKDMDGVVREIARLHPDFVLNTLNGDSNRYFFEALRQAGISAREIPVFSTSIGEAELKAFGPELMVGDYAAWSYFQSLNTEQNNVFVRDFRHRYGQQRVLDDPMEAAYIGVKLWVQALRSSGTLDFSTIRTALSHQTMAAPEGIVAVDAENQHLWKSVRIGRARADGQFDVVWESRRSVAPEPYPFFIPRSKLRVMSGEQP